MVVSAARFVALDSRGSTEQGRALQVEERHRREELTFFRIVYVGAAASLGSLVSRQRNHAKWGHDEPERSITVPSIVGGVVELCVRVLFRCTFDDWCHMGSHVATEECAW